MPIIMNKYVKFFESWVSQFTTYNNDLNKVFPIHVGNISISEQEYRHFFSYLKEKYESEKEIDELQEEGFNNIEEFSIYKLDKHINLLNKYWNNGGQLYRLLFTNEDVDKENLGHHWTHSYDVLELIESELKIEGESKIIEGVIKPHSIDIKKSLNMFYWNSEQEEIYVSKPENITVTKIDKW